MKFMCSHVKYTKINKPWLYNNVAETTLFAESQLNKCN